MTQIDRRYTPAQLLDCVEREVKFRQRVYPKWIDAGKMTQDQADHQIGCMQQIAATIRAQIAARQARQEGAR